MLMQGLRMGTSAKDLLNTMFRILDLDPVEPTEKSLPLYFLASRNLSHMENNKEATRLLERICAFEEQTRGKDHPDWQVL